jgi:hypothetical protein
VGDADMSEMTTVAVTTVVIERHNHDLLADRQRKQDSSGYNTTRITIPKEWTERLFLKDEEMVRMRQAKAFSCADVVIATRTPSGAPVILASKRKEGESFSGKWWMHGGGFAPYPLLREFALGRVEKECGITPRQLTLVGVYLTCAENIPTTTLQPCYVSDMPYDAVVRAMRTDPQHNRVGLFTAHDLINLPQEEKHWYPMRVFAKVLSTIP